MLMVLTMTMMKSQVLAQEIITTWKLGTLGAEMEKRLVLVGDPERTESHRTICLGRQT